MNNKKVHDLIYENARKHNSSLEKSIQRGVEETQRTIIQKNKSLSLPHEVLQLIIGSALMEGHFWETQIKPVLKDAVQATSEIVFKNANKFSKEGAGMIASFLFGKNLNKKIENQNAGGLKSIHIEAENHTDKNELKVKDISKSPSKKEQRFLSQKFYQKIKQDELEKLKKINKKKAEKRAGEKLKNYVNSNKAELKKVSPKTVNLILKQKLEQYIYEENEIKSNEEKLFEDERITINNQNGRGYKK